MGDIASDRNEIAGAAVVATCAPVRGDEIGIQLVV
jgi:hypothetical protein